MRDLNESAQAGRRRWRQHSDEELRMLHSHSRRVYASGFLVAASVGLVLSLFLPWRHHEVPAGSGLPPDPRATIIPMTSGGPLGQLLLTPVLITAITLVLCAAGHYLVRAGFLRVLLIIAAGLAIVCDVALLLFVWTVLSLLDDTVSTSRLDGGLCLCVASLGSAGVGWLLSLRG